MNRYNRCLFYRYKNFWINLISFITIIIICFMLFVIFYFKFNFCYRYSGLVLREGDDYYVSILVDNSWFDLQVREVVVDKRKMTYSIVSISADYTVTDGGVKRAVFIKFDLNDEDKIQNNVLSLYFIRKMTFFEKIKEMIV